MQSKGEMAQNEENILHDQSVVITLAEVQKRGYRITEELKGRKMILFSPMCITDYETIKYVKEQWKQIGSENSYNGQQRCKVLLVSGTFCIQFGDWVINSRNFKYDCGIILFDGDSKPVILYGELEALAIGLACTKKWPESISEFEALRKRFLLRESHLSNVEKLPLELDVDDTYFDELSNLSFNAWKEDEAEIELQEVEDEIKSHFITSRLLLKYFAEKRGDIELVKKWEQQIEERSKQEEDNANNLLKKHQTCVKAYKNIAAKEEDDKNALIEVFNVSLENKDQMIAVFKALAKKVRFSQKKWTPRFASVKDGVIVDLYNYDDFYRSATKYKETHAAQQKYSEQIIRMNHRNGGCPGWESEEDMFGNSASFTLALADKTYVKTAMEMMTSMYNGDHCVPIERIVDMMRKWGLCEETLSFFAELWNMPHQDIECDVEAIAESLSITDIQDDTKLLDFFLKKLGESLMKDRNRKEFEPMKCFDEDENEGRLEEYVEVYLETLFSLIYPDKDPNEVGKKFLKTILVGNMSFEL